MMASGLDSARRLKMPLAVLVVTPARVEARPLSENARGSDRAGI